MVSIIVLLTTSARQAEACLDSIATVGRPACPYETIVVANGTDPHELSTLESREDILLLRSAVNRGFGGGANWAVRHSRGERLLFLNDDALVTPGWLDSLNGAMDSDGSIAVVGSKILMPDGRLQEAGSVIWRDGSAAGVGRGADARDPAFCFRRDVDFVSFASALVRREAWNATTGFDLRYHPAYYEDADICMTLRAAGWRVVFEPGSVIVHGEYGSTAATYRAFLFRRNRSLFMDKWAPHLASAREPTSDAIASARSGAIVRQAPTRKRLLVIDDCEPDPSLGSGFGRMADAVEELAKDFQITFVATDRGVETREPWLLHRRGHTRARLSALGVELRLGGLAWLRSQPPGTFDAVLVSRPSSYARVAPLLDTSLSGIPIVYDTEALWSLRLEREAALARPPRMERLLAEARQIRAIEIAATRRANLAIAISDEEAKLLRQFCPGARVVVVRELHRMRSEGTHSDGFHKRTCSMMFAASWIAGPHSPNALGLEWFASKVLPSILSGLPWARLIVTGANPPTSLLKLSSPNIAFTGFVPDLSAIYASVRVAICPLTAGSGVKIKAVEALSHGVPVVATPTGAEGLTDVPAAAVAVTDDPSTFAETCLSLLSDAERWADGHQAATAYARAMDETLRRQPRWLDVIRKTIEEGT